MQGSFIAYICKIFTTNSMSGCSRANLKILAFAERKRPFEWPLLSLPAPLYLSGRSKSAEGGTICLLCVLKFPHMSRGVKVGRWDNGQRPTSDPGPPSWTNLPHKPKLKFQFGFCSASPLIAAGRILGNKSAAACLHRTPLGKQYFWLFASSTAEGRATVCKICYTLKG